MSAAPIGWDHPDTAHFYARFEMRHQRYAAANSALIRHAALARGMRILDVAAGFGGTAGEANRALDGKCAIACYEPARAMRDEGMRRLPGESVSWLSRWPAKAGSFDRVLCGAAIWQLAPLRETLERCRDLLRSGGCLAFNIPSLYLGEADAPGGGDDPLLLELPRLLMSRRTESASTASNESRARGINEPLAVNRNAVMEPDPHEVLAAVSIDRMLQEIGFRPKRWNHVQRLSQHAYRDWLKIPPTTDWVFAGIAARERAEIIDRAFDSVDADSWRWEGWAGWTAWKC